MSLGRGVEEAILHGLATTVLDHGGQTLFCSSISSSGSRNQPVLEFLTKNGFQSEDGSVYVLNVASGFVLPDHIEWSESSIQGKT